MDIRHFRQWSQTRRAARTKARAEIRDRAVEAAASRPGPPAVALARSRYAGDPYVAIDPLETECRIHLAGVEVRAWVLLRKSDMPPRLARGLAPSIVKLAPLSPLTRQIFFLRTAYGVPLRDIAVLLNVSSHEARHAMLRAIAALDGKRG